MAFIFIKNIFTVQFFIVTKDLFTASFKVLVFGKLIINFQGIKPQGK